MVKEIVPSAYGLAENCQLVIKHVDLNKIVEKVTLKPNEKYIIPLKYFQDGILNYKIKFQERINNRWYDKIKYFYIWNLADFFAEEVKYNDEELKLIIKHYYQEDEYIYPHVRHAINKAVKYIENKSSSRYSNIEQYLNVIDSMEIVTPTIWRNINVLIKHLYRLKKNMMANKMLNVNFQKISAGKEKNIKSFRAFLKKECIILEEYQLPFANFLAGRHYSVLEKRVKAFEQFSLYKEYNPPIDKLLMGLGLPTYFDLKDSTDELPKIEEPYFFGEKPENTLNPSIVVSVDINYLRKYGAQLFVSLIALKKYHFHLHVIGDYNKALRAIDEAKVLFHRMLDFYETTQKVILPTFSTEDIPDFVVTQKTFFACSRFLHANSFKKWFENDVLIIDVDFLVTDDLKNMLNYIKRYDVSLTITEGLSSMTPWTRVMGGTLFLKNNENSSYFVNYLKEYILYGLQVKDSWILDQNALAYANEQITNVHKQTNIFSIPYKIRPLKQFRIRYFMEERF